MKNDWPKKTLGRQVSFNEIIHSWLKDEWHFDNYNAIRDSISKKLLDDPNFSDVNDNIVRLRLLQSVRQPMINPIPIDTEWYIIDFCKEDLERTFIVPSADWLPLTNNSYQILEAIKNVDSNFDHANKIKEIKSAIPAGNVSKDLILVASSPQSVFTIIEGNHRGVAFASKAIDDNQERPILENIFLGISPQMKKYIWHIESRF